MSEQRCGALVAANQTIRATDYSANAIKLNLFTETTRGQTIQAYQTQPPFTAISPNESFESVGQSFRTRPCDAGPKRCRSTARLFASTSTSSATRPSTVLSAGSDRLRVSSTQLSCAGIDAIEMLLQFVENLKTFGGTFQTTEATGGLFLASRKLVRGNRRAARGRRRLLQSLFAIRPWICLSRAAAISAVLRAACSVF